MFKIAVYNPLFAGNEKKYLAQAIDANWISGGPFVRRFEEAFASYMGTKYAVAVCNGTAALETMIQAYALGYLAMSTSTIISCPIAVERSGFIPVFRDISLTTGCMKENNIAMDILKVHSFGNECKTKNAKFTLEDRSQYWTKKPVKTSACYSLYANKLITCGEGGIIITNDKGAYERMKGYRNLCHTQVRFVHDGIGYNFRMTDLQGAVALAQLEQIERFIELRLKVHRWYQKKLPLKCRLINYSAKIPWMTLIETPKFARNVQLELYNIGIETRRFFYPLHRQKDFATGQILPNSDFAWDYWLYLPSGLSLKEKEIDYICKALSNTLS